MSNPLISKFVGGLVTLVLILLGLFLYGKFGPGIPVNVNQSSASMAGPFSATGNGEVSVKPDIAEVSIGVSATAPTVAEIQTQSNARINSVIAAMKKLGIAEADIKTTNYSIYPQYSNEVVPTAAVAPVTATSQILEGPTDQMAIAPTPLTIMPRKPKPSTAPSITSYSMNVNVVVKVRDLTKVNQVIDSATEAGANQVGGINFTVDKVEDYLAEARKKAIADAKKKAQVLASETGIQLVRIVSVYENPSYYPGNYAMSAKAEGMGGDMGQTQLEPGSTEISTQVTLTYETR